MLLKALIAEAKEKSLELWDLVNFSDSFSEEINPDPEEASSTARLDLDFSNLRASSSLFSFSFSDSSYFYICHIKLL